MITKDGDNRVIVRDGGNSLIDIVSDEEGFTMLVLGKQTSTPNGGYHRDIIFSGSLEDLIKHVEWSLNKGWG